MFKFIRKQSIKPLHVGLTMNGIKAWALANAADPRVAYEKSFEILYNAIRAQVEKDIRILSVYVAPEIIKEPYVLYQELAKFLNYLVNNEFIQKNQVKICVLGKWYDLPGNLVDPIKKLVNETKEYDKFFLNLCINYNGQEEIVDACRIIARKVQAGKIDIDNIDKSTIKENLYTSYFIPPDIIIKTGKKQKTFGFLLWDSRRADIYFTEKEWPDFSAKEMVRILGL